MSPEEANNLVQGIYDNIFNAVTKGEGGERPVMPAASTVLSMAKGGRVIRAADFRNPWTPGTGGSTAAAFNTANLADAAPLLSSLYEPSGRTISGIYGDIMAGVQIQQQDPNPDIEAQLERAYATLWRKIEVIDPETGEPEIRTVETATYRAYIDNQLAYARQRTAYMQAYNAAQETESGRKQWPMLAPTLQIPVKQAYDKWRSNYADKIEQALAIQNTSAQNALSTAFSKSKALYESYGVVLDETGGGTGALTLRSNLLPSDWYSARAQTPWVVIDTSSSSFRRSDKSEFTQFGGSAGFSLGIFSIGGSAGHATEHRHSSNETTDLSISFEYALVSIHRPWLNLALLSTKGWNLSNLYQKGQISNGSKKGQENSLMPVLPTAFVMTRKVRIKANWSKSDLDFLKKTTSAGGQIGIGPFTIGGKYSHSSTEETFTSGFEGPEIIVPGVQIIGSIGQVVPYCPPA